MWSHLLELVVDLPDLDVPDVYSTAIPLPNAHTPVNQFQFHVLQPCLNSLVFPTTAASLSTTPLLGTYNLCDLSKASILPMKYLRSLKEHLINTSNPDGCLSFHSVCNPANPKELLPLWVLTIWEEVSWLADSQEKWNASYSWVRSLQDMRHPNSDHTMVTFCHLEVLGWNSPMSLYGLQGMTTLSLAQFLGDGRANDEAIDIMSRFLSAKPTLPHGILIADL